MNRLLVTLLSLSMLAAGAVDARGRNDRGLTRVITDGTTTSGTGRTGDPVVVVAGGALPAAHTHATAGQGGDDLAPDTADITTSLKLPTVLPAAAREIGMHLNLLKAHDGTAARTYLYDVTSGNGVTISGTGATRSAEADFGTGAQQVARGSNTWGLTNAAGSFTFGSPTAYGATALVDITPTFGTGDKEFAEGDLTLAITGPAASFTYGANVTLGAGGSLALTPTFGASASNFVEGSQSITVSADNGLTGGVAGDAFGDGVTVNLNVGQGDGINVTADAIAIDADTTNEFNFSSGQLNLTFGSAAGRPAEGDTTLALANGNSSFTFGNASGAIGADRTIDITPTFGTSANQFCEGDDDRLSDSRSLQAVYTATNAATVGNTVTETTLIGAGPGVKVIPANMSSAGQTYFVEAGGFISTQASPNTIRFRLKTTGAAATTLLDSTAVTPQGSATNRRWNFRAPITVRSTGAGGEVDVQGDFDYQAAAAGAKYGIDMVNTAGVTFNSTVNHTVNFTAEWGGANAGDTITCTDFRMFTSRP